MKKLFHFVFVVLSALRIVDGNGRLQLTSLAIFGAAALCIWTAQPDGQGVDGAAVLALAVALAARMVEHWLVSRDNGVQKQAADHIATLLKQIDDNFKAVDARLAPLEEKVAAAAFSGAFPGTRTPGRKQ